MNGQDSAAVVDLVNSRPHATFADTLDDPAAAVALLVPFGQPPDEPLTRARREKVRALRAALTTVLHNPDDPARGWAAYTDRASEARFQQTVTPTGEAFLRQVAGDPVVGGIATAVAGLLVTGAWARVRLCANEVCQAAFYDTTRSRTQRWHSYEICGNRNNVAAYRARQQRTAAATD